MGPECSIEVLKSAFRRLLSFAYYDTNDMHLRRSISEFVNNFSNNKAEEEDAFKKLYAIANGQDEDSLNMLLSKIRLLYFPKQLKNKQQLDKKFVTSSPREENVVTKFLILSYIPIELLIIDVAWIIQYAYILETQFSEFCLGNRLVLNADHTSLCDDDKVLFYNYSHQYKRWWMNGIEKANEKIKEKKNVTIINLDITSYYHSVDIVFDDVLSSIEKALQNKDVYYAGTTNVVRRILEKYSEIVHKSGIAFFNRNTKNRPLPLSLLSSSLLANWYLRPLDDEVKHILKPFYYARYVDDIILVVESKSSAEEPLKRALEELRPLLKKNSKGLSIDISQNKIDELKIQQEKVYIYSFDTSITQIGVRNYVSEQMERSSEFRFMTDEVEPADLDLDKVTLIGAMEAAGDDEKRFDILEASRYRLAVYFQKLALRLAKCKNYDRNKKGLGTEGQLKDDEEEMLKKEVDKIKSYFKGVLLIKHYKFWEKILNIFVLSGEYLYLDNFFVDCKQIINSIAIAHGEVGTENHANVLRELKKCLHFNLQQAKLLALSLNRKSRRINAVYSMALMNRMNYNSYPLQEFSRKYKDKGISLTLRDMEPYAQILAVERRWVPYHVKFADIVCACSFSQPFSEAVFKAAWRIYCGINAYPYIENSCPKFVYFTEEKGIPVAEFNTEGEMPLNDLGKINVSLVEMELDNSPEHMIKLYGKQDVNYDKKLRVALDKVSEAANTNLFLMPECSLSLSEFKEFYQYSAKHRIAFVSGLEYYICDNRVYNYLVTCLPVHLHGRADAVPVIRRKCFYAPQEVQEIVHCKREMPRAEEVQALYHWKGHVFTTYCCYELCNPQHRSFFFSKIDAMYCPVHNRDAYYFNNIAESTARDMHCYFVLSNVSTYGDSRVSYPAKHDRMNLLKVTGGNTKEYDVTVLSCTLEYGKLRTFQREFKWEVGLGKNEIIKPLPPGYRQDLLNYREMAFMLSVESLNKNIMHALEELKFGGGLYPS